MSAGQFPDAEIDIVQIDTIPEQQAQFQVGSNGVTRIEATTKLGQYGDIPYVRIWCGDEPAAEFCQHNIVGVYFKRKSK